MKRSTIQICLVLGWGLLFSSCLSNNTETQAVGPGHTPEAAGPTAAIDNLPTPTDSMEAVDNPLPAQALEVVFFSEDGFELQGRFYPAAALDRPVLIMMHWYPGDQYEWEAVAYWLQNRGISAELDGVPWLDQNWFPDLPPQKSYNILTFTFRSCEGGCQTLSPADWLKDARASLEAARTLQGVDPSRLIVIGASIGGDAAISSCASALEENPDSCLGALSLSPGSYLGESYPDQVARLEGAPSPRPAWCLYDENDPDADVCREAAGERYYGEGWQGGNLHGMHLLTAMLDPLPLQRILEFLDLILEK